MIRFIITKHIDFYIEKLFIFDTNMIVMVVVKIKENSKQSKAVIEMLKTFDFVEFQDEKEKWILNKNKEILELSKKINKEGTKKAFAKLGIDYDSYCR